MERAQNYYVISIFQFSNEFWTISSQMQNQCVYVSIQRYWEYHRKNKWLSKFKGKWKQKGNLHLDSESESRYF